MAVETITERASAHRDAAPSAQPSVARPDAPGRFTPYLFLAPYLVLFAAFVAVPIGLGLWMSLHDWDFLLPNHPWVGLDNFTRLFDTHTVESGFYWRSMENTAIFVAASVPLLMVIPLLVALMLNQQLRGRSFFRAAFFAPYVLGVGVVAVLWRFILDPNIGVLNHYLGELGLSGTTPWTSAIPWAWVSLVSITVWWTLGFNTVIYLAALQDVPRELYNAAKMDGAGAWHRFRDVTLPELRRVIVFVAVITLIASANMFGQSYLVTNGAPGNATRTAIMEISHEGLQNFRMGSAAAMSFILAIVLMTISGLFFALTRRKVD
jgi:multiple sugar transport system permease protein